MAEMKYVDQFWGDDTPIEGEQLSANGYMTGEHIGKPTQGYGETTANADSHYVEHNTIRYGTIIQDASDSGANMPDVAVIVTNVLTGCTSSDVSGVAAIGKAYEATYTADQSYTLPSTITVKNNDTPLTVTNDYTWTQSSGALKILDGKITGDIEITVTATISG